MQTHPPLGRSLLAHLKTLRWRMRVQRYLWDLTRFSLALAAGLVVLGAWNRWQGDRDPWQLQWALLAVVGAVLGALVSAAARPLPLRQVAQTADRLGSTRDRFLTALDFSAQPETSGLRALALAECQAFLARHDFRALIHIRVPREAAWLIAPILALAMLQWDAHNAAALRQAQGAEGLAQIDDTARQLEELARQAEQQQGADAELKALAEKLKASARDLRSQAVNKEAAEKAALGQLSALEGVIKALQDAPAKATPDELKALAKALEENDLTKDAAAAMQAGKLAEAAKALEDAARQNEAPSAEAVEKALKQALEHMAEQRELSEAMKELNEQLQKSGGKFQEAMQKLAQMLKQQGGQGQAQRSQGGGKASQANLQNLLSALQNMKYSQGQNGNKAQQAGAGTPEEGQGNPAGPGEARPGSGQPRNLVISPSQGNAPGAIPGMAPGSGSPGSEKDSGTTDSPFGEKSPQNGEKGADLALKGQLGEGESLSSLMPATGDRSQSSRRYKELYEAMAPAAEAAVLQEEIPLGSRFFIKRYFEAIRP